MKYGVPMMLSLREKSIYFSRIYLKTLICVTLNLLKLISKAFLTPCTKERKEHGDCLAKSGATQDSSLAILDSCPPYINHLAFAYAIDFVRMRTLFSIYFIYYFFIQPRHKNVCVTRHCLDYKNQIYHMDIKTQTHHILQKGSSSLETYQIHKHFMFDF